MGPNRIRGSRGKGVMIGCLIVKYELGSMMNYGANIKVSDFEIYRDIRGKNAPKQPPHRCKASRKIW